MVPPDFIRMLQAHYGQIQLDEFRNIGAPLEEREPLPYDRFILSQSNFQGWLRVWWMLVSELNFNSKDPFNPLSEDFYNPNNKELQMNMVISSLI